MAADSASRVAVAGLLALAVAIGIGRFAFTPLLPMMQEDAGLSVAAGGWLASANYAGYLFGALSAIAMPVRAAVAIRAGLVAIGLTTLAMGFEDRFFYWAILRATAGIASAFVLIHVSAWSLERAGRGWPAWYSPAWAPASRAWVCWPAEGGAVPAPLGVGATPERAERAGITSRACARLCGRIPGNRGPCSTLRRAIALMKTAVASATAWIVFGMLSLFVCVTTWRVFGTAGVASSQPAAPRGEGASARSGEAAALVFAYGALGFGYIIPATFLPAMARELVHDPAVFGWSWPVFGVAAAASTLVAARLQESTGNRRLLIGSFAFMALGVALPVLLPGIPGILLAALLVGGTFMVATMAGLREARETGGGNPTRLMAAMTAAFAFGQIAGPLSVSYALSGGGDFSPALLVACLLLVSGADALVRRK